MSATLSRRTALLAAAAAPVLSVPALAHVAGADPLPGWWAEFQRLDAENEALAERLERLAAQEAADGPKVPDCLKHHCNDLSGGIFRIVTREWRSEAALVRDLEGDLASHPPESHGFYRERHAIRLAALHEHDATLEEYRQRSGYRAADDRAEAIQPEMLALRDRLEGTPATTPAGFLAKLSYAAWFVRFIPAGDEGEAGADLLDGLAADARRLFGEGCA